MVRTVSRKVLGKGTPASYANLIEICRLPRVQKGTCRLCWGIRIRLRVDFEPSSSMRRRILERGVWWDVCISRRLPIGIRICRSLRNGMGQRWIGGLAVDQLTSWDTGKGV